MFPLKSAFHTLFSLISILLLSVFSSFPAIAGTYGGGSGTAGDPYIISTLSHLQELQDTTADWGKCFKQTANIDASDTSGWDSNKGWKPVGNNSTKFTGTYDGNGHTVSGLYIDRSSTDYIGFFGYTNGSTVKNLGIADSNINGFRYTGNLIGQNKGTVDNCYSTGTVSGGLMAGGLIGVNSGDISNCYSTGSVSASDDSVGGLIGISITATSKCYWDTTTSKQTTSASGTGKTTAEMKKQTTFSGWTSLQPGP